MNVLGLHYKYDDVRRFYCFISCFRKVIIMEDSEQNIHLRNLSMLQSANEEEALNLLFLGDTNRMIAEVRNKEHTHAHTHTNMHAVFFISTVNIEQTYH